MEAEAGKDRQARWIHVHLLYFLAKPASTKSAQLRIRLAGASGLRVLLPSRLSVATHVRKHTYTHKHRAKLAQIC
ncbi:unnamed protein product [Protopolystoma xenopodis]|uniref:Uncharacterized protein n=1 Tax=Protopolystoma xenopodis TaxID=117903 RepID=A0A3S4ZJU2_9PLAT|nr:unnamed protein product [Protopolystoma xenopodis]